MRLEQIISQRPHTGLNLTKLSNKHFNAAKEYRMTISYLSDTREHLDDINDICDDIRDKGYQVRVRFNQNTLSDRDIRYLIKNKQLKDPIEHRQEKMSDGQMREFYMECRMIGIDPEAARWVSHWVHEKSFVKESICINIKNQHEITSIEKKFHDGMILERTKDVLNFHLETTTQLKTYPIEIDDDIYDVIERCKYILKADDVLVNRGDSVDYVLTIYKEVI